MHVFELTDGWDLSQGNPAPFSSHWKAAHAPHWEWRILRHWEWRTLCCIIAPLNPLPKIENSFKLCATCLDNVGFVGVGSVSSMCYLERTLARAFAGQSTEAFLPRLL
jgi:hypothetical protein